MLGRGRTVSTPLILIFVGFGAFITALDQTVVVTVLPNVMLDLNVPIMELDRAAWIITGYLLGYTVAMPLIGRLGDVYGYPRVYQVSLIIFCVGTALVAVSPSLGWMVGARVIQAVGGAAAVPIGMALATTLVPNEDKGIALGIVGASAEMGSMLGPVYGGVIADVLSWRWIFWLNIPQSVVILIVLMWLPNRRKIGAKVDYTGAIVLVGALLFLSLALSQTGLFTFESSYPFLMAIVGIGLAILLVLVENKACQPLLGSFVFRSWAFLTSNLTQMLVGVALIIAMVTVALMANTVMDKSPLIGSLWLLRLTGIIPLGAIIGGVLVSRLGPSSLTIVGLVLVAVGMFLASSWDVVASDSLLTVYLLITGFGFGLVIAPITFTALGSVGNDSQGAAASLVVVSRMLGMMFGLAALSAWGVQHFHMLTAGLEFPLPIAGQEIGVFQSQTAEYTAKIRAAGIILFQRFFLVSSIISLVAVLPALAMKQEAQG